MELAIALVVTCLICGKRKVSVIKVITHCGGAFEMWSA